MVDNLSLTIAFQVKDMYFPIEIESTELVENLKVLIEVQTGVSVSQQVLKYNSQILEDNSQISDYKIQTNDMLQLIQMPPFNLSTPLAGINISTIEAEELQQLMRTYHPLWEYVQKKPDLLGAVLHPDPSIMERYLAQIQKRQPKNYPNPHPPLNSQQIEMRRRLINDPNDAEAKQFMDEETRRKEVHENLLNALEFTPEAFGSVVMLYIDCEVNGTPLKAFVDSGAQMSVMSKKCADSCGISRLMDTNWGGVAKGVGSAKIIGRVHLTQLRVGNSFFNLTVTVLDQDDMDFLLGLDFLKAHQCSIDLRANVLRIGDEEARFLGEGELPKNALVKSEALTPTTPTVVNPFDRARMQHAQPSEENIKILVDMGVTREYAVEILKQTHNNINLAASLLLDK